LNSHEELQDIHDQSNGCRNLIAGSVARYAAASSAIAAVTGANAGRNTVETKYEGDFLELEKITIAN
jgi:hypothetical protein